MQFYLAVTLLVFVILGSKSVSGCGLGNFDSGDIVTENGLTPNGLRVYSKQQFQSAYQADFNINGEDKKLTALSSNLYLITNETINKWTTFNYSEAVFRFIVGTPVKVMMYDAAANYHEENLGKKWLEGCQDIDCSPYVRLPAFYWFKLQFLPQDGDKYALYSTHMVPSMEQFEPRTVDDEFFPA